MLYGVVSNGELSHGETSHVEYSKLQALRQRGGEEKKRMVIKPSTHVAFLASGMSVRITVVLI